MKTTLKTLKESIRKDNAVTAYQTAVEFEAELREILEWNGKPLNPLWHQQIVGQKKLAREILGEK